jgi:hypothetical protein
MVSGVDTPGHAQTLNRKRVAQAVNAKAPCNRQGGSVGAESIEP